VVLQNIEDPVDPEPTKPESPESGSHGDFSQYQLLSGPPAAGTMIAFKTLHMSANYTPGKEADLGHSLHCHGFISPLLSWNGLLMRNYGNFFSFSYTFFHEDLTVCLTIHPLRTPAVMHGRA
jgi:hypothetical protein